MTTRRQLLAQFVAGTAALHLLPRIDGSALPPAPGELEWRPFHLQNALTVVNGYGRGELEPGTSYLLGGVGVQFNGHAVDRLLSDDCWLALSVLRGDRPPAVLVAGEFSEFLWWNARDMKRAIDRSGHCFALAASDRIRLSVGAPGVSWADLWAVAYGWGVLRRPVER